MWDLNPMTSILIRDMQGRDTGEKGEHHVGTETKSRIIQLMNHQKLKEVRNDSPIKPFKEV